jgi:isopentenyl-diphosphate Delta-isomerase
VTEQVVLLDDDRRPIGTADKATVHGERTPLHLAFSCYGFDGAGRRLTNTCCGHPGPGEDLEAAARRRLAEELGLRAGDLRLVLPDFAYRASAGGIEENEFCPVFVGTLVGEPAPRPDEVDSAEWWEWDRFLAAAADASSDVSPWARLQAPLLDARRAEWGLGA